MRNIIQSLSKKILAMGIAVFTLQVQAQPKDNYNVAIFFYDGMELLDFAGPTEVFAATNGFTVYSISVDGQPIKCNATGKILNEITPDYAMDKAPAPDVVIFPGGGTGTISKDQNVITWVKNRAADGTFLMSVCTGASVLANTGLLAGKNITTWHGFIPTLQSSHPELNVLENTRFVDNGVFLTTAGVSAGIDGALHLISRIKGLDVALATTKYMEYDKWDPKQGRVEIESEYIEQLRKQPATLPKVKAIPYEGELKNLAFEFRDKGQYKEAIYVLEACAKLFPNSGTTYAELARLNRKLGKPAPVEEDSLIKMIKDGKSVEAFRQYEKDQVTFPGWIKPAHGGSFTRLAIQSFEKGDYNMALRLFQLVAKADPGYGSYYNVGETYIKTGNRKEAIASYKKSLEFQPDDEDVKKIISELETSRDSQKTTAVDLQKLSKNNGLEVYNRALTLINEPSFSGIRLSKEYGEGIAWIKGVEFSNGILEFDVRGEDVKQHSFVGIAFHGVDNETFDAIYLRPFQFKEQDETLRSHGIQYISLPAYTWRVLRERFPDKYEHSVDPAPEPDSWVHVRVVIKDSTVSTFINGNSEPTLVVEKITAVKKGSIGFYVADTSGGDFANLTITKTE